MRSEQEIRNKINVIKKEMEELATKADYYHLFKKVESLGYKDALEWILS